MGFSWEDLTLTRCVLSDSIGMDTCQKEGWRWQAFRLRTLKKWIIRIGLGGGAWQLEIARMYVWVVLQMDVDGWGWVGNVEKRYAAFLVIFLFYNIICIWCFFTCDNNYYLLVSMHWVFNVWIRYMVNPHKLKKGATLLHWREYRWIGLTLLYWRD